MKLYFFHGYNGSPGGKKSVFLRERYPNIIIPHLPNHIFERLEVLSRLVEPDARIIGSSLGGLSALMLAESHPELIAKMVLLAPAVGFSDPEFRIPVLLETAQRMVIPADIPTTVIAGIHDEVIPLSSIEALIARSPNPDGVVFHKIAEGHSLTGSAGFAALEAAAAQLTA